MSSCEQVSTSSGSGALAGEGPVDPQATGSASHPSCREHQHALQEEGRVDNDSAVSGGSLMQNNASGQASLFFEGGSGSGTAIGSGTSVAGVNNATGKKGLRNAAGWLKQVLIALKSCSFRWTFIIIYYHAVGFYSVEFIVQGQFASFPTPGYWPRL